MYNKYRVGDFLRAKKDVSVVEWTGNNEIKAGETMRVGSVFANECYNHNISVYYNLSGVSTVFNKFASEKDVDKYFEVLAGGQHPIIKESKYYIGDIVEAKEDMVNIGVGKGTLLQITYISIDTYENDAYTVYDLKLYPDLHRNITLNENFISEHFEFKVNAEIENYDDSEELQG